MATPNFTDVTWLSQVLKHQKDYYEPDDAYEFSNKRKFKNTDKQLTGIYGYPVAAGGLVDDWDGSIIGDDGSLIIGDDE